MQGDAKRAAEAIHDYVHMILADKKYKEQEEAQRARERRWEEVSKQSELTHMERIAAEATVAEGTVHVGRVATA